MDLSVKKTNFNWQEMSLLKPFRHKLAIIQNTPLFDFNHLKHCFKMVILSNKYA